MATIYEDEVLIHPHLSRFPQSAMCFAFIVQDSSKAFETCWNGIEDSRFRSYPSTITKENKEPGFTARLKEARPMSAAHRNDLEKLSQEIRKTCSEEYLERVRNEQGTTGKPELRTLWRKDKVRIRSR